MDETRVTQFPPGRYGRRREPRRASTRLFAVAGFVVASALGTAIALKMYDQYGPAYQADVIAFDTSESSVEIVFEVSKPAGEAAECQVRARGADGAEVGRETVPIPADESRVRVTHVLATRDVPVTGEVQRCYPA